MIYQPPETYLISASSILAVSGPPTQPTSLQCPPAFHCLFRLNYQRYSPAQTFPLSLHSTLPTAPARKAFLTRPAPQVLFSLPRRTGKQSHCKHRGIPSTLQTPSWRSWNGRPVCRAGFRDGGCGTLPRTLRPA